MSVGLSGRPAVARHDVVRLSPAGWRSALAGRPDLAGVPMLAEWAANGWPLVARRRCADDPAGTIALGLPLPPAPHKRRLAFAVPTEVVLTVEPPPSLATLACVPDSWRETVESLIDLGRRCGAEPRAFGSFAFANLTTLSTVTSASDLDVLWPLAPTTPQLLAALPAIEAAAPGRIDGEIVDGAGRAANWRELAGDEVLVKALEGVALVASAAFLRAMPA